MKPRYSALLVLFFAAICCGENIRADTLFFDGRTISENWEKNWTNYEKKLWYGHLALQIADTITTIHALEQKGVYEANSFVFGKHPSQERLIVTKAVIVWGLFSYLNDYEPKGKKETGLTVLNILYSIVVANNISIAYLTKSIKKLRQSKIVGEEVVARLEDYNSSSPAIREFLEASGLNNVRELDGAGRLKLIDCLVEIVNFYTCDAQSQKIPPS